MIHISRLARGHPVTIYWRGGTDASAIYTPRQQFSSAAIMDETRSSAARAQDIAQLLLNKLAKQQLMAAESASASRWKKRAIKARAWTHLTVTERPRGKRHNLEQSSNFDLPLSFRL